MDVRGISTAVDATVFLLLVSGAVVTLVGGTGAIHSEGERSTEPENPAAEGAALLATTTATIDYSVAPATASTEDGVSFHRGEGTDFHRTAHGTLASLLADAAVGNATVGGEPLSRAGDQFERRLASAVRGSLARSGVQTSVRVVWEPYPDAPLGGEVHVGDRPPRDVDVHAATMTVGSGLPASRERARQAAREDGFGGVASVVADVVVSGLFPERETRLALRGEYPVDALTAQRYRRTASLLDAGPPRIDDGNVSASNDRLRVALARRFESDLSARFDSPGAAARAVETGAVDVTVRTWSP